jgi:RNA polymerase sigma-70 factor, ECF subfamily
MSDSSHRQTESELWAEWSQQHAKAVWGYLWGVLRRHDLADDLTQEVFCRAWQNRDRYQEQGKARFFFLRIADRLAIDYQRRAKREVNVVEDDWKRIEPTERTLSPLDSVQQQEMQTALATALDRLSPAQRRVLLLRYYSDMPFAEIASITESPIGTVLSHCRRGLLALRGLLATTENEIQE